MEMDSAKTLAKYQRRMARRQPGRGKPGSRGYRKAKRDAAKVSKKVASQRQDAARKWAIGVVRVAIIAAGDFNLRFLAKSRMARKSADAAIRVTKHTIIEKCSNCGAIAKQRLKPSERVFVCHACGVVHER